MMKEPGNPDITCDTLAGHWRIFQLRDGHRFSADDLRPEQAIVRAGLTIVQRQLVYFRAMLPPRMALFTCAWQGERLAAPPVIIRDRQGRWTAEYLAIREEMGASTAFLQWARSSR